MYNTKLQHLNHIVYRKGRRQACLDKLILCPLKLQKKKKNQIKCSRARINLAIMLAGR